MHFRLLSDPRRTVPGTVGHLDGGALAVLAPAAGRGAVAGPGAAQACAGTLAIGMATWLPWRPGPKDAVSGLVLKLNDTE